jgi:hypothetical protein
MLSAREGRVQACRRRRSQLLASERAESLLLGLGETLSKKFRKFPGVRQFKVSSRAYTRVPAATGLATGGWRRRRESQESASASGGTVQSDQRRGASDGDRNHPSATARACHKERISLRTLHRGASPRGPPLAAWGRWPAHCRRAQPAGCSGKLRSHLLVRGGIRVGALSEARPAVAPRGARKAAAALDANADFTTVPVTTSPRSTRPMQLEGRRAASLL